LLEQGGGGEGGVGGFGGEFGEGGGEGLSVVGLDFGHLVFLACLSELGQVGGVHLFGVASGEQVAEQEGALFLCVEAGVIPPEACDDEQDDGGQADEDLVAVLLEVFGEVANGFG